MGYIGPAPKFGQHQKQVITGDSSTVTFTLDYYVTSENNIMVIYNGVIQEPGAGKAYTTSGNSITFSVAPTTGSTCWIIFLGQLYDVGTVADGAITSAKIANDTILKADLNSTISTGIPVLLGTVTASTSASVDFTSLITTDYDVYLLRADDITVDTNDRDIWLRSSTDNGVSFDATTYYGWVSGAYASAISTVSNLNQVYLTHGIATMMSNDASAHGSLEMYISRPTDATVKTHYWGTFTYSTATANIVPATANFSMTRAVNEDNDAFQILPESGNLSTGNFYLYGLY